jgi:plastocyanin
MAGNSWSITIVKGKPCTFEPDVYCPPGTPKPKVLTAETTDSISWNNQTRQTHEIWTGEGAAKTQLTAPIGPQKSSGAYSPQATGTINYYCSLHEGENGTIEVVS